MVAGDLTREGDPKLSPRLLQRRAPGLPLPEIISSNNKWKSQIKLLNKVTFGDKGKHSLFAVCQPGTPRNRCLRPIEVEPLIRNNRTSEKEGTIREAEARDGKGGKDASFTL